MIIAIDGTAAAGKSTLARRVAAHYRLDHLDTGSLYRAVARDLIEAGKSLHDAAAGEHAARELIPETLADPQLRMRGAGEAASIVAAIPEVRAALLAFQRSFAEREPGAVIEGRDIGTVVCPGAHVKIFVTATAESRAHRRYKELYAFGEDTTEDKVLRDLQERDRRDRERAVAPMLPAEDALLLDTTGMTIEKAFAVSIELIDKVARHR